MEHADVAVVGAGLAGAATAFWLTRLGAGRVRVLEQGEVAGAEASAQNAGMLRRLAVAPAERALACRAARWLCDPPGDAWTETPCYRRTGAVIGLAAPAEGGDPHGPGGLAAAVDDLRARGVTVEEPELDSLLALAPALAGATVERAWYLPEEGLLDAHAIVQGCLAQARNEGARVQLGVTVHSLVVQGAQSQVCVHPKASCAPTGWCWQPVHGRRAWRARRAWTVSWCPWPGTCCSLRPTRCPGQTIPTSGWRT